MLRLHGTARIGESITLSGLRTPFATVWHLWCVLEEANSCHMVDQGAEKRLYFLPVLFCPDLGEALFFREETFKSISEEGEEI